MVKNIKIKIYGRVQGVWFRESARKKARELNITGYIRNEPDGSVYAEAEGAAVNVDKFINWCRQGPELAKVEKIKVEDLNMKKDFKGFVVRR